MRAGKLRNTIVHAVWQIADEYPDALVLTPSFGLKPVYEEKDFIECLNRTVEAWSTVFKFILEVQKAYAGRTFTIGDAIAPPAEGDIV